MTKYLTTSGELITLHEIRRLHPNVSIPADADLSSLGYTTLISTPKPGPDPWHTVTPGIPLNGYETWVQVPDTSEKIVGILEKELERFLDSTAKIKKYDSRITCAMRAGYPGVYQEECQAFSIWMDECYRSSYTLFEDILSGAITPPTKEDYISNLPPFTWP
jgi:hypothetical protein